MELLSGPSLGFLIVIIWSKFVFEHCLSKRYKNTGFNPFLNKNNCAQNSNGYCLVQVCLFVWTPQKIGPDNNPYLDQMTTIKNGPFLFFLLLKMCWMTIFKVLLEHQPKFAKRRANNDEFSHFAKHWLFKKTFCCNPLFTQNWCL